MTPVLASHPDLAPLAAGFALGLAVGLFHFATLRRVASLYLSGGPGRALALQLARLVLLAAALAALVQFGATPLLAGTLGLLAGRFIILRQGREAR